MFLRDGSVHHIGVENEKWIMNVFIMEHIDNADFINFCKEVGIDSPLIESKHEGGPNKKNDGSLYFNDGEKLGVSIKNHKSGTLDYINTSKIQKVLQDELAKKYKNLLKVVQKGFKDRLEKVAASNQDDIDEIVSEARVVISDMAEKMIADISSTRLQDFIKEKEKQDSDILAINDIREKEIHFIHKKNRVDFKTFMSGQKYELRPLTARAKNSQTVFMDGKRTNMRIRVVLNNGVNALLGLSKSNKDSIWTIKVQNDDVRWLINDSKKISIKY